jgi:hypothetical protein
MSYIYIYIYIYDISHLRFKHLRWYRISEGKELFLSSYVLLILVNQSINFPRYKTSQCQRLRGLMRWSTAARLFGLRRGHGCLFLVIVACCQVEVSATGRSLAQRSSTECVRATECNQVQP